MLGQALLISMLKGKFGLNMKPRILKEILTNHTILVCSVEPVKTHSQPVYHEKGGDPAFTHRLVISGLSILGFYGVTR